MTFYSIQEAAKVLDVHPRTITRTFKKIGRKKGPMNQWRLTDDDLKRLAGAR